MHAVLISVGTDGDILPYAGLAATLRRRGHRVTLVAAGQYEPLALRLGLGFQALISAEEHGELFGNPDFWNPLKTAPLSARWGVRHLRRQYDLLANLVGPDSVIVANPAVFAASLIHETHRLPWANLVLQPWMIPSTIAPPVMPHLAFLSRAPRLFWQAFCRGLDFVGDRWIGPELNGLRARLGLPPVRRILGNWLSPQLVIGMFPDWYGPPQPDWPPQLRLTGFPLFDGGSDGILPSNVAEFCRSGESPVAFTFGTGMANSARLFQDALEACKLLGRRGIFLTRYKDQLPSGMPGSLLHCDHAPFHQLFPQCAAVVHHGGIGTVAEATAAGIPQVIRPICFDQFDNGLRMQRLGAGICVPARRTGGKPLADALGAVMTDRIRTASRDLKARFDRTEALETSAVMVETLAPRFGVPGFSRQSVRSRNDDE